MEYLNGSGGFFWKVSDRYKSGLPDIIGVYDGRFVALEVKRPGINPRPLQAWFLDQIGRHKGVAEVVHSVDETKEIIVNLTTRGESHDITRRYR